MDSRPFGRTSLTVPRLGLGTVKIGRNRQVKYSSPFDLPTDREVEQLLEAALELGVTLWDTAPAYGRSEERLRPWLRRQRGRIVLCTKAGETFDGEGSHHDFRSSALVTSLEGSLERLGTDYVDLLLLHSDGRDQEILEETDALEGLTRCRQEGKARAIGLSAKTAEGVRLAAEHLDAVMAPFGSGHPELGEALAGAHARGCGVLVIKTLGQGHAIATATRVDPLASALRFALERDYVDSIVFGTRSAAHLRETVAAAERAREGGD